MSALSTDTGLWPSCLTCGRTPEAQAGESEEEWAERVYCSPGCHPGPGHLTLPELVEELQHLLSGHVEDPLSIAARLGTSHGQLLVRLTRAAAAVGKLPKGKTRAQHEEEMQSVRARLEWARGKGVHDLREHLQAMENQLRMDDARRECGRLHARLARERHP